MPLLQHVDYSAIRVNQSMIILMVVVGFILNVPLLVGLTAVMMLAGSLLWHRPGFIGVYLGAVKPSGLIKPDVIDDNPEPHLFAQGFGGTFLLVATVALFGGAATLGWVLCWLVVALAALNLFGGFCVGCAMYYLLHRLGAPGFIKAPPAGTFPGLRPRSDQR